VLPENEGGPEAEALFRGNLLSLLADIRDYNKRTCEAIERVLGGPDDPRRKAHDLYRDRS
jgi:hypothetical protein